MNVEQVINMVVAAAVGVLTFYTVRRLRNIHLYRRARRFGVHPINAVRDQHGHFKTLYRDLRQHEDKFINYTRLTFHQFDSLLDKLLTALTKSSRRMPICPAARLLITLRYYASEVSMVSRAYDFRVGVSTVSQIVHEKGEAMWHILQPLYLATPTLNQWEEIAAQFELKWNLPNCVGALDGKHVNIRRPQNSGSQFFCYKKYFSINLMALVDANTNFIIVDIGAQGSAPDANVFRNSVLGVQILNERFPLPPRRLLPHSNIIFPFYFVGDEAFPLCANLMRQFPQCDIGHIDTIVKACVCLHNFINANNVVRQQVVDAVDAPDIRGIVALNEENIQHRGRINNVATALRNTLCNYFFSPAGSVE